MTLALSDSPGHETAGDPGPDRRGRALRDLRISVTDRCNCRCTYCMPRDEFGSDHSFLPRQALLDFDEITRVATTFVGMGVRKIRLTGGEPLTRRHLRTHRPARGHQNRS
jgi:cyclic pyranopterin phosphate synthase